MRFVNHNPILSVAYRSLYSYPAPANLTYFWNFGVYAIICLVVQIITGLGLAMHYIPDISLAFLSVEHIMRDVNYGWLLRYTHANGASMFFIVVYIHMLRGIYYGSYMRPRQLLWIVGVIIFLLMIIIAFMGYVLPWGQMSFWGATVITNLFSAVPFIGSDIVVWLWGGYSVGNPTLTRFFALHFFLPFVLAGLVIIHLIYLHKDGSNNPLGVDFYLYDAISFYPYYIIKDIFGIILFVIFFSFFVFFYPNLLGHPDNYIPANPLVTPTHIVPEWYLLMFYAILRSIPDKLLGVLALAGAVIILVFIPILSYSEVRSYTFKPLSQFIFWFFFVLCFILGWVGSLPVKYPFVFLGKVLTIFYFLYFIIVNPFLASFEKFIWITKLFFYLFMAIKNYRKNYYTNQLRIFETDTKYKTIGVRLLTGESTFDSAVIATLAQGQVDMINFTEAFSDMTEHYSPDYALDINIFRWSYSISFTVKISAPTLSFLMNQFFSDYGFDSENFIYSNWFIDVEDLWYIVYYYSNVEFFSLFMSASAVLNHCTSRSNFKINLL